MASKSAAQVRRFETLRKAQRAKRFHDIRHVDAFLKRMKRLKPNDLRGFRQAVATLRNKMK